MNIKWTINNSNYDEEKGISFVTITTELGVFSGVARLHEEDRDIASKFQGCRYAEMRAVKKYLKLKLKLLENKIEGLTNYYNNIKQMRCFNENEKQTKFLTREIQKYMKQYVELEDIINNLTNGLSKEMNEYRTEIENFYKKIKKESEPTEK